ncbi:ABC transporter ATP-binding protein [Candidatus Wolfebacteria bacterium]|nr:ABC transporter ATP-binding protein [Candidatus Wolfebacteria bacterium]
MHKIFEALKVINRAYRGYRRQITLLSFLGLLGAFFEGIGVTAVIPLFALINGGGKLGDDFISKIVIRVFSITSFNPTVKTLVFFIFVLFISKFFITLLINRMTVSINTRYFEQISNALFVKMADSSWSHLAKEKIGHLQNLISVNAKHCVSLLTQISSVIVLAMNVVAYVFLAFNISIIITSATLILGVLILFLYWPSVYKLKKDASRINKYKTEVSHYVNEKVVGMKTIKAMHVVEKVKEQVSKYFKNIEEFRFKILFRKKVMGQFLEPIVLIYMFAIFFLSYKRPGFSIAAFAVILFLIQRIFNYVNQIQSSMHGSAEALPFLKSVLEYMSEAVLEKESDSGTSDFRFMKTLEFKKINFSYKSGENILSNISFAIKQGGMVGLVGPSGAGKTTIADLILRLTLPSSGLIAIDGEDISRVKLKEWRRYIGYVPQDIFLINDTIAANIRFFDDQITDEQLVEVAKMANIYDFILTKPSGFATKVGERGVSLSAGQRQRIVLARILARKPALLILDEATSALDNESELIIQRVIQNLKGKMTVLIIAHRLTTVLNCDEVFVLQDGEIIENGEPHQLLSNPRTYFSQTFNVNR